MEEFLVRTALYTLLPLVLGAGVVLFDRTAVGTARRLEAFLVPLFIVGIAGGGISAFFAHTFLSDYVAGAIGWPLGNPFQLEVAFANLALGVLGGVAAERSDGFREAAVIAVTIFGVGASIVHVMDIFGAGNLAPGNLVPAFVNLVKPAILIVLLVALRRAEWRETDGPEEYPAWRRALVRASVAAVICGASGFALGFQTGHTAALSAVGIVVGVVLFAVIVGRAPSHRATASG